MKKVLKKRKGKLTSVYLWAVDYSQVRAKARKEGTSSERKGCRHSPEEDGEVVKSTSTYLDRPGQLRYRGTV